MFYPNGPLKVRTHKAILEGGNPLDTPVDWKPKVCYPLTFSLLDSRDQMDDTKFFEKIGPFGILALFFAFFPELYIVYMPDSPC